MLEAIHQEYSPILQMVSFIVGRRSAGETELVPALVAL